MHTDDGEQLSGGITDNATWKTGCIELALMPERRYDALVGKVGRRFARVLSGKLRGVRSCRWNVERFIVFQAVILKHVRHVTAYHAIRRRIRKNLDAWEVGHHQIMVKETAHKCNQYLSTDRWDELEDHRAKTLNSLVLRGKLQNAVRWIKEREKGGLMQPGDACSNTGKPIM